MSRLDFLSRELPRRAMAVGVGVVDLTATLRLSAETVHFTAVIDDTCTETGSPATGVGQFLLDTETREVRYRIEFDASRLLGTERFAHVHGAAANCDAEARVIYDLPPGSPKVGTATLTEVEMEDMLDGLHYVLIHTDAHIGGEIRGAVLRVERLPAAPLWALWALCIGLGLAGVRILERTRRAAPTSPGEDG